MNWEHSIQKETFFNKESEEGEFTGESEDVYQLRLGETFIACSVTIRQLIWKPNSVWPFPPRIWVNFHPGFPETQNLCFANGGPKSIDEAKELGRTLLKLYIEKLHQLCEKIECEVKS